MVAKDLQRQDFAQTLARGLLCLEVLSDAAIPLTNSQIAARMDVSRAAARRILLTLEHLGYVLEQRSLYAPTPKVLALGRGMIGNASVWGNVNPEVIAIANRFDEPCSISVLEGLDIMFVCRDSTRRIYTSRLGVGDRLPAHCSASGKMLLSSLPEAELNKRLEGVTLRAQGPASITEIGALKDALSEIRRREFALAVDEMEAGTVSVAVPLRDHHGRPIAAMSVASHRSRISPAGLEETVLPVMREAALRIETVIRDFQDRGWFLV
ncbi:MAG TPA: IclR family transcriptional regulator C-terminal domain-containing protein [Bradyrhizobium sp.]|nr:IclR family transcriptional regulator C-terminal domain-containing protein [Bradyrhizobium sp.]